MASMLDAAFMPVAAIFVIFFLVPGMMLAPKNSADFATEVSHTTSRMMMQSIMSTYMMVEDSDGRSNYKSISYKLSGKSSVNINKQPIRLYPVILSYYVISYDTPSSYPDNGWNNKILSRFERTRATLEYEVKVPLMGGEVGGVAVNWQVY
jgi:hypothetical protein